MNLGDILVLKDNEVLALLAHQERVLVHSAAMSLQNKQKSSYLAITGCEPINFEVAQFLLTLQPEIQTRTYQLPGSKE